MSAAPGYVLACDWLDARCFEEYTRQAHDALAAGDREEAARLLRAGLALWRGPALRVPVTEDEPRTAYSPCFTMPTRIRRGFAPAPAARVIR